MISNIPTLTIDGFVENDHIKMYKLFEYFMASDYSQSNVFHGKVASLRYILATKTPDECKLEIENVLRQLYGAYFDEVNTDIAVYEKGAKLHIYINLICSNNGKQYNLNKSVKATMGAIENYEKALDELWEEYNKKETYEIN